ncbi:M48 family metallopeptidase [Roseisalinus antarcticus]|uniref:TPR repeat-containing protein YfgC n=1 Tax=Roseisalinus antarcticus TaxID=254357 RepID=A0A1Y5TTV7_9RHOB|nr:M48 family metallopeptidase [Roseisalinus antarcticus]SLN72461.1 TPR repeat-containing protein YfgC precursor [Roseisalinus antarcticus]
MAVSRLFSVLAAAAVLSGCAAMPDTSAVEKISPIRAVSSALDTRTTARNFISVVEDVEPIAERECRARAPSLNCDFRIVVDDRAGMPPNAFQTLDDSGRPVVAFTLSLIADARNKDELAFVLSHEAAHHIQGHLDRQRQNADAGAIVFGQLAGALGARTPAELRAAQEIGAAVGARSYSKAFELEADTLGTLIAKEAGFDPLVGAEFFFRIPEPSDAFLSTHPPNEERVANVRRTVARLGR